MAKTKNSTSIIIAKTLAVTGFAASVLLTAAPAHALDFTFSFQDKDGGDQSAGTQGYITGTLSGLVEGSNSGTGITATVTSSPGNKGVSSGYNFYQSGAVNAFVVTGGNITFANVQFNDSSSDPNSLYLVTSNNINSYSSQLINNSLSYSYGDSSNLTTQFTPVPFELNSTVGLATLGICFGAAKLRRNYLAKKLAVSQDKGWVEV